MLADPWGNEFCVIEGDRDRLIELGATLDDGELLEPDGIPFRLH